LGEAEQGDAAGLAEAQAALDAVRRDERHIQTRIAEVTRQDGALKESALRRVAAIERAEAMLEEACLEADVPFLPLLEGFLADPHWPQWLCSDGLHLNGEGHRRLYERVHRWPALLEWAELRPLSLATSLG
jgi:hypothetical protein